MPTAKHGYGTVSEESATRFLETLLLNQGVSFSFLLSPSQAQGPQAREKGVGEDTPHTGTVSP